MLLTELQQNDSTSIYVESLSNVLAIKLIRQYSHAKPDLPVGEGGLSPHQLRCSRSRYQTRRSSCFNRYQPISFQPSIQTISGHFSLSIPNPATHRTGETVTITNRSIDPGYCPRVRIQQPQSLKPKVSAAYRHNTKKISK
jgi:hypothetical protein